MTICRSAIRRVVNAGSYPPIGTTPSVGRRVPPGRCGVGQCARFRHPLLLPAVELGGAEARGGLEGGEPLRTGPGRSRRPSQPVDRSSTTRRGAPNNDLRTLPRQHGTGVRGGSSGPSEPSSDFVGAEHGRSRWCPGVVADVVPRSHQHPINFSLNWSHAVTPCPSACRLPRHDVTGSDRCSNLSRRSRGGRRWARSESKKPWARVRCRRLVRRPGGRLRRCSGSRCSGRCCPRAPRGSRPRPGSGSRATSRTWP